MANKYLEKIAGFPNVGRAATHAVGETVKAVGRAAIGGAKFVGRQVHNSTGGAFINHAHTVMGETNVSKLSRLNNPAALRRRVLEDAVKKGTKPFAARGTVRDFDKKVLPGLKRKQRNARITLGAMAAGTAYVGTKVKDKMDEPKVQTYNY